MTFTPPTPPAEPKIANFKSLIKRREKQNEEYQKASKAKKRVMIAQDVLKALRAGYVKAQPGVYFEAPIGSNVLIKAQQNPEGSFQELLPELPACGVCAKGAIFLCTVLRQNQVKNSEITNGNFHARGMFADDTLEGVLGGVFSARQLRVIENEFECRRVSGRGPYAVMGLQRFGGRRRMEEIMRNIVANKGMLKPVRSKDARSRKDQDIDDGF